MTTAVTFDFWNTLMAEPPGLLKRLRREAVVAAAAELGGGISEAAIDRELAAAGAAHDRAWSTARPFDPAAEAARFGAALSHRDGASLAAAFLGSSAGARLTLAEGIAPVLRALRDRGVALAIVCDVGLTPSTLLRDALAREGLLELFGGWAFSDEVGCFKPAAAIFQHALDALGVGAAEAVHVGDLRRTDVAGARALGMATVRYRGVADDTSAAADADHVIDRHAQLIPLLG
ncbi:HAD family hydrolase [Conexibacter stalactiti]|uniref:HAD family hydrolase n=1 Tax=Conexibacter stalactiti TaxID=1940611 RepID=A0ABU4HV29_9ACTN|nr:HAD family hydrolase [Conexibacter stalactiti]MDW5596699.1 HAD family hydrolase [Conexibacter stalactiti]MEC5037341.1 HAD family hydrolase [Conexibacter stalactiti]